MKNMVLLTKEEYDELINRIARAKQATVDVLWRLDSAVLDCCAQQARADHLWDLLNRPVIEATVQKHEEEFLDWCADKAAEYEKKDFDEWVIQKAKFYNNNRRTWCKVHHIPEEDYERCVKYDDWLYERRWVWDEEKTEGWTELYRHYGSFDRQYEPYFMVYDYMSELFNRGWEANNTTERDRLWHIRSQQEDLFWDKEYWKNN